MYFICFYIIVNTFVSFLYFCLILCLTDAALRGRRGIDRIVAGFTTTHAISAYHH
jgi:hypothetical protein